MDRQQSVAKLRADVVGFEPRGQGDDAFERTAVDLDLQRLAGRSGGRRPAYAGDPQPIAIDRDTEVAVVDAGQLGDDGEAVADAVDVEARAPARLEAKARCGGEAENPIDKVVDPLAEPLEVFIPARSASGHGSEHNLNRPIVNRCCGGDDALAWLRDDAFQIRYQPVSDDAPLFTLEQANALIPRLELIMERMQRRGIELRQAIEVMAREGDAPIANVEVSELLEQYPELRALVEDLQQCIGEIEACGGHFKGLELGLVDFPSEIEGQVGLLCWQYGEKEITHWHPLDGGFAGRQPLPSAGGGTFLQ